MKTVQSTINIMFDSMFNIFLINKEQLSKAIASFSLNNVLKFLPSVKIYVFIPVKTTSQDEGHLRTERI